jgi:hypothetical protein
MESVLCRAELHDATTREQYAAFHAGMGNFGLEQTITRNGVVSYLPTGAYLGVNLSTSLESLGKRIDFLALQITGHPCKLILAPVNPASIYISGLESPSFASEVGVSF